MIQLTDDDALEHYWAMIVYEMIDDDEDENPEEASRYACGKWRYEPFYGILQG